MTQTDEVKTVHIWHTDTTASVTIVSRDAEADAVIVDWNAEFRRKHFASGCGLTLSIRRPGKQVFAGNEQEFAGLLSAIREQFGATGCDCDLDINDAALLVTEAVEFDDRETNSV